MCGFLSLLATAPFLLVAKSPPTWLPQKTPGKASSQASQADTHRVHQAAKLFQQEEHPLDGCLHLPCLQKDIVLQISKWFPGRQTPFTFFSAN